MVTSAGMFRKKTSQGSPHRLIPLFRPIHRPMAQPTAMAMTKAEMKTVLVKAVRLVPAFSYRLTVTL